ASTLTVNGNLTNNSNSFYTGYGIVTSGGSNMLNVNGAFTNNGAFYMYGNQEGGGGSGDTLTVTGTLTNAAGATFELIANSGAVANVNALSNSGTLLIGTWTTLDITGGGQGLTDLPSGSTTTVQGTTNALGNLTSLEGTLTLENGQSLTDTPNGATLTVAKGGTLTLSTAGTTLSVTGALSDAGSVIVETGTTLSLSQGLAANVTGILYLGNGETTTVAPVGGGGTLTFAAGSDFYLAKASTLTVNGNLTNSSNSFYTGYGQYGSGGSNTLNVNGAFTNNGAVYMYGNQEGGGGSGDTLNVTGTFTNAAGATFELIANSGSVANVNALSNLGSLTIGTGTTLNITGGGQGLTDLPAGSTTTVQGTLNVVNMGVPTSGLGNLT